MLMGAIPFFSEHSLVRPEYEFIYLPWKESAELFLVLLLVLLARPLFTEEGG